MSDQRTGEPVEPDERDEPDEPDEPGRRGAGDRDAQFRAFYRELRVDDQRAFYEAREREYDRAHHQSILVRNTLLLLLSALLGVAGQFSTGTGRAACGVAAAVLAALAGAVTAFEALIGFAQLRKLYGDTAGNLRAAALDWQAAGPGAGVEERVERIERIFRTENGRWGQLMLQRQEGTPPDAGPDAGPAAPERP
ncbi:SLATT domain-containing protein [Nonomuraea fuscirosea]|uniref:SLATT domain-containing protein n=1 Tax=Nonomuraea fuscirosea TaxID=1291556 RepID=UPI0033C7B944